MQSYMRTSRDEVDLRKFLNSTSSCGVVFCTRRFSTLAFLFMRHQGRFSLCLVLKHQMLVCGFQSRKFKFYYCFSYHLYRRKFVTCIFWIEASLTVFPVITQNTLKQFMMVSKLESILRSDFELKKSIVIQPPLNMLLDISQLHWHEQTFL